MKTTSNHNEATSSIWAEDILKPVELAQLLHADNDAFACHVREQFSPAGRAALALAANGSGDAGLLAKTLAQELSSLVHSGQSLYDPGRLNGAELRRSTSKLRQKDDLKAHELARLNMLLLQDVWPDYLDHDSCEWADTIIKRGVTFNIYKERRRLKTKWNVSFRICYNSANGPNSTHAPSLNEARKKIPQLADHVLSGKSQVPKPEATERDARAAAYTAIEAEVAKLGVTQSVLEFVRDAVKAQQLLTLARPLLEFVVLAVSVLVKPVTRTEISATVNTYAQFVFARKDIDAVGARKVVALIQRFASGVIQWVRLRRNSSPANQQKNPSCATKDYVDEIQPNDIQAWLNGVPCEWKRRRDMLDNIRAFMAYCRDALHALPQGPTAAHLVPRPKPDANAPLIPVAVLTFLDTWRILINLLDLESLFAVGLTVFAGLHESEVLRLEWGDIEWRAGQPTRIYVPPGKGKNRGGNRKGYYVEVRYELKFILILGKGLSGKVVRRAKLFASLMPLIHRLRIKWDQSIMRHTFASNLLGIGLPHQEVATQMRNSVEILLRDYYAPLPESEVALVGTIPVDISFFKELPLRQRCWSWSGPLYDLQKTPTGFELVTVDPQPGEFPVRQRKQPSRQVDKIAWPSDLELQVLLWEKSQPQIAKMLSCSRSAVGYYAKERKLLMPPSGHYRRLINHCPVEIPEAVLRARDELRNRKLANNNSKTQTKE